MKLFDRAGREITVIAQTTVATITDITGSYIKDSVSGNYYPVLVKTVEGQVMLDIDEENPVITIP